MNESTIGNAFDPDLIARAVALLKAGELVAIPTETVYGLAADATNPIAVQKIFRAKGRPSTNPLIVHVADASVACRYCTRWSNDAQKLADAFWPGPLTIVLPKTHEIDDLVTAGKQTVGLRAPDHLLTLALLRALDKPLAAPSANRSNRISPTQARHVQDELGDSVSLILDGGACRVGIESTVIDLCSDIPTILRPGAITQEMLQAILDKPIALATGMVTSVATPASSPGQHSVHYAPTTPAFWFQPCDRNRIDPTDAAILEITLDPAAYAKQFYAKLRLLDSQGLAAIYIELPPDVPAWHAVRDRILRATKPLR